MSSTQNSVCSYCCLADDSATAALLLLSSDPFVVYLAQPAYNAGHIWITTPLDGTDFTTLSNTAHAALYQLTCRVMQALTQVCHPDGFNVGFNQGNAAGKAEAQHFCWQIVPRWAGDANFTFSGGNTKALGINLLTLCDALRQELHAT